MAKKIIEAPTTLTRDELELLAKIPNDVFLFSTLIYVIHPIRGKVHFNLYPYQKSVLYQFIKDRFNVILKFRQAGITELISMYCLWLAMYHPNKKINIISIKDNTAKKVLKKIKYMYKNLPWYLQVPIINGRAGEYGSASMMEFDNGSFIESIPTSPEAGRSESLSLLVIDEAAMVRWASQIWAAAVPTLSTGGSAIVNSCVTADTEIITRNGLLKIGTVCPQNFGVQDISMLGIEVLTHKLQWKRVTHSVNKGKLKTWKIKTSKGTILKCTPAHKLLTTQGWKPVKEIVEKDLRVIEYDLGLEDLEKVPVTTPPKEVIWKEIFGFPNYRISNQGVIERKTNQGWVVKEGRLTDSGYLRIKLWDHNTKKNFNIHRLVWEAFNGPIPEGMVIDHIDMNQTHNYITNLELVTVAENTTRATKYSYSMALGSRVGKIKDLQTVGIIKEMWPKVKHLKSSGSNGNGYSKLIIDEVFNRTGYVINKAYVTKIIRNLRTTGVTLSKIKILKEFMANIYDISVEDDQSYFTNPSLPSHNTPRGLGNFYHSTWVDALAGGNPFTPIRLRWNMHPERDEKWYKEMASALGPRRTAQEVDGDFLGSGNTVFDLSDIRDIENCLSDYPPIIKRYNGQYRQFNLPEKNQEYFIGADVATGRATDYSSFTVMNKSGEEQACYKGKMPVDSYAKLLGDTGQLFNFAVIAPESNDVGLAVTSKLQMEGYPKLYYYQKMTKKKGKSRPEMDKSPGWLTTNKNRSVIIDGLESDVREENIIIKYPFFVQEAYTFIYDSLNRPVAMGKHRTNAEAEEDSDLVYADDDIMGKAITNHIRKGKTNVIVQPR